jgi:acetolactate synthase I/II/III large subunit
METVSGAEMLRRCLVDEEVSVLFGYPGGAILPFYDALYGQSTPRHVLMRHEQFAAFAADGYARATGRVGVCVATSGPGASNLVTGLATSLMDSVPVVAITGQVSRASLGTDAFQELDVVGLSMAVTKHAYLVQELADLPKVVSEAFRVARSGRPGPTLIDVPKDVLLASGVASRSVPSAARPMPTDVMTPSGSGEGPAGRSGQAIEQVWELLALARRPVLMVGRGVVLAGVADQVLDFAEQHALPVITTLLGLDAFPAEHPLSLGMPGMHGHERANLAIQRADLVIGLGLRFDDRVTGRVSGFAPLARVVHFDICEACAGRTVRPHLRVIGDLRSTLPALMRGACCPPLDEWWSELRGWSREAEVVDDDQDLDPSASLKGRTAIRLLARCLGDRDAIVVTDVGQHQMWLAQELGSALPGSHLTSGGLGAMGFALPAAIGALVGRPDRETWVIAGDGGFQMSAPELATVVQERLPLRIAVHNNAALGLVWQWQSLSYGERFVASRISGPDFVMLARSHGIPGRRVRSVEELTRALVDLEHMEGPFLLDVQVPTEEHVYPMVQPGKELSQMLRGRERVLT